ncbi:hypothetical protein [Streptomyces lichenis]|uniref:Ig-like domain-containing protein n=1 Tax=Streptomyces lichenis TaxID=2306967 RepID=A0ABT0I8F7_9ACTN|nr:hypothetical protein [Streptomyces lichenis]MCK8677598.1 hypothetical protein [Streptomyces lichenis]
MPSSASPVRARTAAAALICLTAAAALTTAPTAAAAPATAQGVTSVQLQWADAQPANPPFNSGTLTVGGVYTCTEPTGTSVTVTFNALQILPMAIPSGSGVLPCGPGVVDAPWQVTSYPNPDVHSGYTSVFLTFDGQDQPPQQFTA